MSRGTRVSMGICLCIFISGLAWGDNPTINFELENGEPAARISEKGGQVTLRAHLSAARNQTTYVNLKRTGSASGSDYQLSNYSFVFQSGQLDSSIVVTGRDDSNSESDESAVFEFNQTYGIILGSEKTFTVTIADDDSSPQAQDVPMLTNCKQWRGAVTVDYCIHRTIGSRSPDVLYYMHGAYGNKYFWLQGTSVEDRKAMRIHWRDSGQDAPVVVVISMGSTWLLTEQASASGPATFDFIADEVIPGIESQDGVRGSGGRRLLMGISMGGFNALQLYMKRPQMWDRAAVIAPLIPLCDPFLPNNQLSLCVVMDPYNSSYFLAYSAHTLVKSYFPTRLEWDRVDPLVLGQSALDSSLPPIMMTSGTNDDFGFFKGDQDFAHLAQQQGAPMTWVPTDAKHGGHDPSLLGDFILAH